MFWKKKSKETGKKLFKNPTETRGSFRVYPSKENPILLKVGSTSLNAVDISAGGISFDNKAFKLGAKYPMELTLPKGKGTYKVSTEILKIDEKNVYLERGKKIELFLCLVLFCIYELCLPS